MYFIYVDESGNRDVQLTGTRADGMGYKKDWLYVLSGVSLFHEKWYKFEYKINQKKIELMERIYRDDNVRLELADTEVKSRWLRIPGERARHPFLSRLTDRELQELAELYLSQPRYHSMRIFGVVVDKRHLHPYMNSDRLHRKAYELLIERVEWFIKNQHPKHRALMIVDNTSRQMNRSLAMKHSYFQREGTSSGSRIGHIVELPLFVESYLSNGVQLADLCAYNIYRAFRDGDLDYQYFTRIAPSLYSAPHRAVMQIEGLKVFPDESPLVELAKELGRRREVGRGDQYQ